MVGDEEEGEEEDDEMTRYWVERAREKMRQEEARRAQQAAPIEISSSSELSSLDSEFEDMQ